MCVIWDRTGDVKQVLVNTDLQNSRGKIGYVDLEVPWIFVNIKKDSYIFQQLHATWNGQWTEKKKFEGH